MFLVRKIISFIATIALSVVFVGAGFLVCTVPLATQILSNSFSDDVTSPFSRSQLVKVAIATRDYSFGDHSKTNLYKTIYEVDFEYVQHLERTGAVVPNDFPKLNVVTDLNDFQQIMVAFQDASEVYCYSSEIVSHLDDCYRLASTGSIFLFAIAIVGAACVVIVGILGGRRKVGSVLLAAGFFVLVVLICIGIGAIINFNGFFTLFHSLFFNQGNWTFSFDSLLICALPTPFWMSMGVVWIVTSIAASILSIVIGKKCK